MIEGLIGTLGMIEASQTFHRELSAHTVSWFYLTLAPVQPGAGHAAHNTVVFSRRMRRHTNKRNIADSDLRLPLCSWDF